MLRSALRSAAPAARCCIAPVAASPSSMCTSIVKDGFEHPRLTKVFDLESHNDIPWQDFKPGIRAHFLYKIEDGPASALLKFDADVGVPPHWHAGVEHVLCLDGSFTDENGSYGKGDLMINPPGSHHREVHSKDGCIVLMSWTAMPQFMK